MKEKKGKTAFTAGEVAVLIEEDLRAGFRSVGDGLLTLREKIESLEDKVESVRESQGETLEKITLIELRLTRIESDFTKRLAALEASHK